MNPITNEPEKYISKRKLKKELYKDIWNYANSLQDITMYYKDISEIQLIYTNHLNQSH